MNASPAMNALLQQQDEIFRQSLNRLREHAPSAYRAVIRRLKSMRGSPLSGLGATDDGGSSWGDLGMEILDSYLMVRANEEVQSEDRKALELELKKLQEQNKSVERQLELQNQIEKTKADAATQRYAMTLQQKAAMAGESVWDQILAKPWALPAAGALAFVLFRGRRKRAA